MEAPGRVRKVGTVLVRLVLIFGKNVKFSYFRLTIAQQTNEGDSPKGRDGEEGTLKHYQQIMIRSKSVLIDKLEETAV
jgi:hypothetical protein